MYTELICLIAPYRIPFQQYGAQDRILFNTFLKRKLNC